MNKIVYIHGLNGSTNTHNTRALKDRFGDFVYVPELPDNPVEWEEFLNKYFLQFKDEEMITIIGSSTGGLFADYFAEKFGYNKVLINPVVDPTDLKQFIGINKNYNTGKEWVLTTEDVNKLSKFVINTRKDIPTFVFLGINDTILDYTKAEEVFKGTAKIIKSDESHVYALKDNDLDIIYASLWVICF